MTQRLGPPVSCDLAPPALASPGPPRRAALPLLLAALLGLALVVPAGGAGAAGLHVPAAAAPAAVPPIPFTERVLKNGLRVLFVHDASTPEVAVQVWYGVGSRDDPEGRSGFAHLFEHMMFKATRDMASEEMDRLTEDVGGMNNASTSDDFTNFYEVIPANHLGRLLWAEAQRMSSLEVDQPNFLSERAVVEEELRQSYLANPYGRLMLAVRDASYGVHPYKRSTIGSIGDLEAAGLNDVKAFHDAFYRPDNAVLIVVGDVAPDVLDALVDQDFGAIGDPDQAVPRPTAVEAPRTGPRIRTVYAPHVPLPAVDVTWAIPSAKSPDLAALRVADALLSAGDSSRLSHDLVYQRRIAQSVGSDAGENADPSLFQVQAVMAGGVPLAAGEAALLEEVKALRQRPVSAAELARAKNQLLAAALLERETPEGKASELGRALLLEGDAGRADTDLRALQGVTAADVERVARTYLRPDRRVVVRYLDDSLRPANEPRAPDLADFSPAVAADVIPKTLRPAPPPASLAHSPPPAAAPGTPPRPRFAERTLVNGLRVILAKTSDVPIVTAELSVAGGAATDPPQLQGLASLTTDLLQKGAGALTASQIAEVVEGAGGSLRSDTSYDASSLTLTVLSAELGATLPILAEAASRPAFAEEEIDRLRKQRLDDLSVALTQPGDLAEIALAPAVFGPGGYGGVAGGVPSTLSRIARADILSAYARAFRPTGAVLVMTGNIEPEAGFALAERTFGSWRAAGRDEAASSAPPPAGPGSRVIAIDLPGAAQAAVLLGGRTIARSDPRYFAVRAANAVLGGGYSARLNEEVRVKRGLSYGAFSRIDARRVEGLFVASAQTKNSSAAEVASLMMDEVRRLGTAPLSAEELSARIAALSGGYGRGVQTSAGLAGVISSDAVYGVDLAEVADYPTRIQAVTPDQARAAAPLVATPSAAVLIVVGDAKTFFAGLKARFPNAELLKASALGLEVSPPTPTPGGGQ